jgi:hypothetical protein
MFLRKFSKGEKVKLSLNETVDGQNVMRLRGSHTEKFTKPSVSVPGL